MVKKTFRILYLRFFGTKEQLLSFKSSNIFNIFQKTVSEIDEVDKELEEHRNILSAQMCRIKDESNRIDILRARQNKVSAKVKEFLSL